MTDENNIVEQQETVVLATCSFNCSEQNSQICRKCQQLFCVLHSSRFSPNFCQNCFQDLSIIEDKFERVFDSYDSKNDKVTVRKEVRSRWFLDGPDWPFLHQWIDNLTDEELKVLWVFHHFVMRTIEAENETRKVERVRKLRGQVIPKLISTQQTTTVKRTITKQPETPETVKAKLRKQGIPENIIEMMIRAMNI